MRGFRECLMFVLSLQGICSGLKCKAIPGNLVQIDAGNGQVFGVNKTGHVFTLFGNRLQEVPGVSLTHVTVGPAGVWGVNKDSHVYRLVWGDWVKTTGSFKQMDAGSSQTVTGVNALRNIYCLSKSSADLEDGSFPLPWVQFAGRMKYYSCGPLGCWSVSPTDSVFFRHDIVPKFCAGSRWEHVQGSLSMIEVGTDGSVYGANSKGHIYRRQGITACNLVGTHWEKLSGSLGEITHVTYDLNVLWALSSDGKIQKCRI